MWRSRRKSSREIDSIDGLFRRSSSKVNFIHSSFKDVENLFDDDDTRFNETLDQPSPCSTTAAARRLSIFHRVHFANKFARVFSAEQIRSPTKSPPESNNVASPEKFAKSDGVILISTKSPPESNNVAVLKKLGKSNGLNHSPAKSPSESDNLSSPEKLPKSDRVISIPGSEKRVVVYTTSLRVVRPTFEACRAVKSILRSFRVSIDERDLSMDTRFLEELQNIMADSGDDDKTKLTLPRVFIGGRYVGGAEEVKQLHESGELKKYVEDFPAVSSGECEVCGEFKFILCDECRGSHKCYTEKGGFRSCTLCNENGLIRCSFCLGR